MGCAGAWSQLLSCQNQGRRNDLRDVLWYLVDKSQALASYKDIQEAELLGSDLF